MGSKKLFLEMGSILKVDCEFYDEKSERRGRTKIQWLYATLGE